jgi:hypothetical protein
LQADLAQAQARFQQEGFTRGQLRALQQALLRSPALYASLQAIFRGERIDWFFRQAVQLDEALQGLVRLTPRGVFGPDVIGPGVWWDVTTVGQWAAHEALYSAFGEGIQLFY